MTLASIPAVSAHAVEAEQVTETSSTDTVFHDITDPNDPFNSQSAEAAHPYSSLDQKRNPAETALCARHPVQCTQWAAASHVALSFQESDAAKKIIAAGKSNADKRDRKEALRHQFWMARLTYSMKDQAAWEWARAHESGSDPKSRDSICDRKNNQTGNQIGNAAEKADPRGEGAVALDYITKTVKASVSAGKYCAR